MNNELLVTLFMAFIACQNYDENKLAVEIAKENLEVVKEKLEVEKELLQAIHRLNENLEGGTANARNI